MVEFSVTWWIVFVISLLLHISGVLSMFLVFFPGLTVVWVGQLVWMIANGFNRSHEPWQFTLTIILFIISTLLMLGGSVIDNVLMARNTRARKTPWHIVAITWLTNVVGGIVFTPVGGLALSLLVLYAFEYYRNDKDSQKALASTKGWATGCGTAAIVRLIIAGVMTLLWLVIVAFL